MRKVGGLREEKKKMLRCLLSVKAFKVNAPIRSINIFDSLLKGSMTDQQRKMMENLTKDPAAMKDTLNKLQDVMKGDGGGIMATLLRNQLKPQIDKLGGIENIQKMMQNPEVLTSLQQLAKDPTILAKYKDQFSDVLKDNTTGQKDVEQQTPVSPPKTFSQKPPKKK